MLLTAQTETTHSSDERAATILPKQSPPARPGETHIRGRKHRKNRHICPRRMCALQGSASPRCAILSGWLALRRHVTDGTMSVSRSVAPVLFAIVTGCGAQRAQEQAPTPLEETIGSQEAPPPSPPSPKPTDETAAEDEHPDFLAGPRLFGLQLGKDSPEAAAEKLGVSLDDAAPCPKPHKSKRNKEYCWATSANPEIAGDVRMAAYDTGALGVVATTVTMRVADFKAMAKYLDTHYAAPNSVKERGNSVTLTWDWDHSVVEADLTECIDSRQCKQASLAITHRATRILRENDATLTPGSKGEIAPLGLRLGYDSLDQAVAKLESAGYRVGRCEKMYELSAHYRVGQCRVESRQLKGFRWGHLRAIARQGEDAVVYGIDYVFDPGEWPSIQADLAEMYGTPTEYVSAQRWWLGENSIDADKMMEHHVEVRYFHGRWRQYAFTAMYEHIAAEREAENKKKQQAF